MSFQKQEKEATEANFRSYKKQYQLKKRTIKTPIKEKYNCVINIQIIKSYKIWKFLSAGTHNRGGVKIMMRMKTKGAEKFKQI